MKIFFMVILTFLCSKAFSETIDCMTFADQVNSELSSKLPGNKSSGNLKNCLIDFDVVSSTAELNAVVDVTFWQRGCVGRFCTNVYKYSTDIGIHANTDSSCKLNLDLSTSDNNVITKKALGELKPFLTSRFETLIRKNAEFKRICRE